MPTAGRGPRGARRATRRPGLCWLGSEAGPGWRAGTRWRRGRTAALAASAGDPPEASRSATCATIEWGHPTRLHRSLGLGTPQPAACPEAGAVRARLVLGGLHHAYERAG